MEKEINTKIFPYAFIFGVVLYIISTLIVYYTVDRPQNSPDFPSFNGSLVNWQVQAAGTICMAISCFAFLCIGQLIGHSMYYIKQELAVPINIITDIAVLVYYVALYVPRIDFYTPNGILLIIFFVCIIGLQVILYFCEKKPMLEQNAHTFQQSALFFLNAILFIMWLVFWIFKSPDYSKYVVAGVSYAMAIAFCLLVLHFRVEISDVKVNLVYDLPPEIPYP